MDVHSESPSSNPTSKDTEGAKLGEKLKARWKSSKTIQTVSCSMDHYELVFDRKRFWGNRMALVHAGRGGTIASSSLSTNSKQLGRSQSNT